jgi:hypothetical protein
MTIAPTAPRCPTANAVFPVRAVPDFVVDLFRRRDRVRDLLSQQGPESLPQSVHRRLHRFFRRPKLERYLAVGNLGPVAGEEPFELLELLASACLGELFPQLLHYPLEERQRPTSFENLLRGETVHRS